MTRWSHELSFYSYTLTYKPGASHYMPDLLSRKISPIDEILNPQTVAAAQQEDPLWNEVRDYLQERRMPRQRIPLNLEEFELRVISIPSESPPWRESSETYCRLRDHYYFPQMLAETKRYVNSCLICQRRKGRAGRRAPYCHARSYTSHGESIGDLIDLLGSTHGNRYVLAIIDHFTRYLQLIPLPNKEAQTVANAFIKEYVTLFGPPRLLVADNGREFHNRLFSQVVKDALATLIGEHPNDWDEKATVCKTCPQQCCAQERGQQPLYLMTGRDGYFPRGVTNEIDGDEETAQVLRENLRDARIAAKDAARKAQQGWARDYNRRLRQRFDPAEGDLVLLRIFRHGGPGGALGPRWSKPARIVKKLGPVNFLIREPDPPHSEVNYHINQMRPYVPNREIVYPELDSESDVR
ncbi:uncharacterized protein LOC119570303 [Penaeus monodon]|uniref:uncharacterized protein LOC119570303 n=1 Tax=Penaeus monodon TaxID=6687 RepID=UPI0018A745E8|nr:uncharacterized protein LOC119570303 [Penaeus monodon]